MSVSVQIECHVLVVGVCPLVLLLGAYICVCMQNDTGLGLTRVHKWR